MKSSLISSLRHQESQAGKLQKWHHWIYHFKAKDRLSIPLTIYSWAALSKYDGRLPRTISSPNMNLSQRCSIDEPVQKIHYVGSTRLESNAPTDNAAHKSSYGRMRGGSEVSRVKPYTNRPIVEAQR